MNETLELLNKINWVMEPIADFVLYFFTTKGGISLLIIGFIIYFLASYINAIYLRNLLHRAAKSYGSGRMGLLEKVYLFFSISGKIMLQTISKLPVLLGIFIFLWMLTGLSKGLTTLETYIGNQNTI